MKRWELLVIITDYFSFMLYFYSLSMQGKKSSFVISMLTYKCKYAVEKTIL